jgi:hypothetical protein
MPISHAAIHAEHQARVAMTWGQRRYDDALPPDDDHDTDSRESQQALGDATVMVAYCGDVDGVEIEGVNMPTGFVPVECFSARVIDAWREEISRELQAEAQQANDAAAQAAAEDAREAIYG